jgi:hypothetical protein
MESRTRMLDAEVVKLVDIGGVGEEDRGQGSAVEGTINLGVGCGVVMSLYVCRAAADTGQESGCEEQGDPREVQIGWSQAHAFADYKAKWALKHRGADIVTNSEQGCDIGNCGGTAPDILNTMSFG